MYVQYDINILSILLLGIILVNNLKNKSEGIIRQRYFRSLIISNMLIMMIDTSTLR